MEKPAPNDSSRIFRYRKFCAEHPSKMVNLNGHWWACRAGGNGNTSAVLLLPGALGRPETSFEYITTLAPHLHVLALAYPVTTQTMTALADGAAALLEAFGVRRAHVVGGSFGGLVAQALLARHPDKVGRIVLSDTSPPNRARAWRMRLSAALIRRLPEHLLRRIIGFGIGRYVSALPSSSRLFWGTHFREMLAEMPQTEIEARASAWAEFDSTQWPTFPSREILVLAASSDRSVSPHRFLSRFPHAKVHVVDSPLGHAASIGDADAYISPILTFLTNGMK